MVCEHAKPYQGMGRFPQANPKLLYCTAERCVETPSQQVNLSMQNWCKRSPLFEEARNALKVK